MYFFLGQYTLFHSGLQPPYAAGCWTSVAEKCGHFKGFVAFARETQLLYSGSILSVILKNVVGSLGRIKFVLSLLNGPTGGFSGYDNRPFFLYRGYRVEVFLRGRIQHKGLVHNQQTL